MAYGRRLQGSPAVQLANRLAAMGYAIPGTIIAVGVLVPFAAFDNALDAWLRTHAGVSSGLLLTGSISALRSEEHTSELQSLMRISYAVFCLKKKKHKIAKKNIQKHKEKGQKHTILKPSTNTY